MKLNDVLDSLNLVLTGEEKKFLNLKARVMKELCEKEIKKSKIKARVFIGGSLSKNTIVKSNSYEIDLFVAFDWKYESISDILRKILKNILKREKFKVKEIHGSRDYFRIEDKNLIFEIIPVVDIKKPREARNVTDLSYFHVNYVKNKVKKIGIPREIIVAKAFCKAQGFYGAESYIQGFSGYALECLIIYYKTFEKMLKALSNTKEKLIIDPESKFKNKKDILMELNESRLQGPIVLIDPTWKERNVLAALSSETFKKFQNSAKNFLKNPKKDYFIMGEFDENKFTYLAKKKKAQYVKIILETNKQEGDIAGTKLKKAFYFILRGISEYSEIFDSGFQYSGGKNASGHVILKLKREITKKGPPLNMKKACIEFKKTNKNIFEKNGFLFSKNKLEDTIDVFMRKFLNNKRKTLRDMNITNFKIKN